MKRNKTRNRKDRGDGAPVTDEEVIEMTGQDNGFAKLLGLVTVAVCVAALLDPRFRKACISLLRRLGAFA